MKRRQQFRPTLPLHENASRRKRITQLTCQSARTPSRHCAQCIRKIADANFPCKIKLHVVAAARLVRLKRTSASVRRVFAIFSIVYDIQAENQKVTARERRHGGEKEKKGREKRFVRTLDVRACRRVLPLRREIQVKMRARRGLCEDSRRQR